MTLPELSKYPYVGLDTETTGLDFMDQVVGLSWSTPDGQAGYLSWGHEAGGGNCSLDEVREWAKLELTNPETAYVFHNAQFDLRMLFYTRIAAPSTPLESSGSLGRLYGGRVDDTGIMGALLNELEKDLSLDGLAMKYLKETKDDESLYRWLADEFGGRPTRTQQAKRIWRAPHSVVAPYAKQDAVLTRKLYEQFRELIYAEPMEKRLDPDSREVIWRPNPRAPRLDYVYEIERQLIPIVLRLHLVGVPVDLGKARALRDELAADLEKAESEWHDLVGDVNVNSTAQLAELFRANDLPVETTDKGNPSLTKDFLKTLGGQIPEHLLKLRKLKHYGGTFLDSYIFDNAVEYGDHARIHGRFHQTRKEKYGTVSGRFSSGGGLNLQNVPSRDEVWAPKVRGLFVPLPGMTWGKLDYSQIEYRFLAHYAGGQLRAAYLEDANIDFHQMVADLAGIARRPAKDLNFATVYGAGIGKVTKMLGCSRSEAKRFLKKYHRQIPEIREVYDRADRQANRRGWIRTWGERGRRFPASEKGRGHDYTYRALNALLQGSAADLLKIAMLRVDEVIDHQTVIPHLTVHDELDFSTDRPESLEPVREVMEDFRLSDRIERPDRGDWPTVTVPIKVDVEAGPDWGHVETLAP